MAKTATTTCYLILLLLNSLGTELSTGTDSLSCNFIVKYRSSPGQCSVNGKPLLHFEDGKEEGNAPEVCADLPQSLKDIFDEMTNLESGLFKSKGNHTLHVKIKSQYNQGDFIDGLWAFSTDGQHSFYFYPTNMTWTVSHADAIRTMRHWENDRELVQSLRTLSGADFSHCLMTYSREMPGSTIKVLNTTQPTYTTQKQPSTNNNQHTSDSQGLSITRIVILCIAVPSPFITLTFAFSIKS
ncbi:histocompatibility antigen 60b-like [Apodemus sylvaticus]|uniref:histocompatibility antigen 60b-like n=1 Tax=Apodemus sylvaticus TaxID=10129 RepID=UPI002243A02C|nr:histocompatibility antigen 60b-like [Apodemus sylvaticus]